MKSSNTTSEQTTPSEPEEIVARSDLASELDIEDVAGELMDLPEGKPMIINGREVVFREGKYRMATGFGTLEFDDADGAARFCIRAGFPQKQQAMTESDPRVDGLGQKLDGLGKQLAALELLIPVI